ncbi:MAG: HAMP domain-containing protein, partial [Thermodesulfovibrionales bacterium]|nr:HAMP domain-containing protein [Thermodesulfovibrionales bacterium]
MVFRAKTRRKRSLIFRFFIIFVAVLFASILALLVVAGSIQISNLQKEAELIANRILDFKVWVIQSTPIKNHAVATKELGDVVSSNSVYSFKIISFNSKDVDAFESQALKAFSENEELTYIDKKEGLIYNYAKPLRANKACLKCHTNYREDQLSGFISVKISNASILPEFELKGGFFAYLTILVAFLLVIYSFAWFELRIIRPLGEIDSILEQVKGGDYGVRIHFKDRGDELGDLANTFNATMDKLVTLIQTDEERRQMQQNILKFLETLSSASEGDLTRRLEVTTDIFGSLADAFNFMVEGLSELIEKVKASAEEVNIDTARIMSVLRQLESGASSQMLQVDKANQSVNKAAISAHEITEKAKVAEEISLNATNAAIDGSKAVKSSLEGIQLIRYT